MIAERFLPVEGFEDYYEVSNHGRVRSLHPKNYGLIMRLELDRDRYHVIKLKKHGISKTFAIHRLVYSTFKEAITSDDIIHHIDERKLNNIITNLMKLTVSEHRALHNKRRKANLYNSSILKQKIMKKLNLSNAKKVKHNIIARGEVSGHSHIATGDVEVLEMDGEIYLDVKGEAAIKHLLEEAFTKEGKEVWTGEHADIKLEPGTYKYVAQVEFDPYDDVIRRVND